MFRIRYEDLEIEKFVRSVVGDEPMQIDGRDRLIAAKYSTIAHVWYAGEPYGTLWIDAGEESMEVPAYGATVILVELARGREALCNGSGSFDADSPGGGYGVSLRLERDGECLRALRTPRGSRDCVGPEAVETTWDDFTQAVDEFDEWYHTKYLSEASWLLRLEFVQQLRADAGYPRSRL